MDCPQGLTEGPLRLAVKAVGAGLMATPPGGGPVARPGLGPRSSAADGAAGAPLAMAAATSLDSAPRSAPRGGRSLRSLRGGRSRSPRDSLSPRSGRSPPLSSRGPRSPLPPPSLRPRPPLPPPLPSPPLPPPLPLDSADRGTHTRQPRRQQKKEPSQQGEERCGQGHGPAARSSGPRQARAHGTHQPRACVSAYAVRGPREARAWRPGGPAHAACAWSTRWAVPAWEAHDEARARLHWEERRP